MESLKIYHDHDQEAKTLTIWFDDPQKEFLVYEMGEDMSLIKLDICYNSYVHLLISLWKMN
ncbi:MAG: hypothetical protein WBM32_02495 [Crocosphaera sp.]|jgi:hypothetical protein